MMPLPKTRLSERMIARHGWSSGWPSRCASFTSPWPTPTASIPTTITCCLGRRWGGSPARWPRASASLTLFAATPARPRGWGPCFLFSRRSLQALRRVHPAVGMGDSNPQQPVFGSDRAHRLGNRRALLQPERSPMVGVDLGPLPGRHAVCGSLDLGYVAHHVSLLLGAGDGPPHTRPGQLWAAGPLFGLLWGFTGLSNPALLIFLPACGLWAWAPDWKTANRRSAAGCAAIHRLPGAVDLEELGSLPPLRACTGQFRRRVVPGKWTGSDRPADGVRSPHTGPRSTAALHQDGRDRLLQDARRTGSWQSMRADPMHFAGNTLRRVFFFWAGVPHPVSATRLGRVRAQFQFHLWQCLWVARTRSGPSAESAGRLAIRLGLPAAAVGLLRSGRPRPLPPPPGALDRCSWGLSFPVRRVDQSGAANVNLESLGPKPLVRSAHLRV